MVLLLAVTSNVFGAVFARLGTANWITETMLALPLPPVLMLIIVLVLIFLLGWPFEWPAIILVFLPIFYPVVDGLKGALGESLGIPVDLVMVWFGATVAVVLQTAFLSPPVAMSAYYLRQVVKEWSLATIYKGMFEFMILQVFAIALIVAFPAIATKFPEQMRAESAAVKTEEVDDSMNRLEADPLKGAQDEAEGRTGEEEGEAEAEEELEKDPLSKKK
jgi:TRAP-type mannitol/chloroaromatic compound transport system permease large subunit